MMYYKRLFLISISILISAYIFGQTSIQKDMYQAFLKNDENKWNSLTQSFEKRANLNNTSDLLQLIHCYYGYVSVLIDKKKEKLADSNIKKAEIFINKVLKSEPNNAVALNYKAVFLSYYISMNKMKVATLSKTIIRNLDKAYRLSPNNVQILFDKGNSLYYPPKIFGGNKKEALKYFQKAISILEKQKNTKQNWMYVQMLFLEARCYELLNNMDAAKKGYEKTLSVESNFKIVKDKYYPALLKKIK